MAFASSLRKFDPARRRFRSQITPTSRNSTPAAHEPASTVSMPKLKRKIAVAAAERRQIRIDASLMAAEKLPNAANTRLTRPLGLPR